MTNGDCTLCKFGTTGQCVLTTECRFDPLQPALPWNLKDSPNATASQVGGDHYSRMAIQPFTYIHANGIGFAEGCVIKYVSRWRSKNGIEDLKKARHFLDLLIEAEEHGAA